VSVKATGRTSVPSATSSGTAATLNVLREAQLVGVKVAARRLVESWASGRKRTCTSAEGLRPRLSVNVSVLPEAVVSSLTTVAPSLCPMPRPTSLSATVTVSVPWTEP
jgi:hypothetical protein